jgi:valyl-tRNA synthetase
MTLMQEIIGSVRNLRGELDIAPSERLDVHIQTPDGGRRALIERHQAMIKTLVPVAELHIGAEAAPAQGHRATAMVHDVQLALPISEELHARELERLKKELARAEAEEKRLAGKLANEKFASRAPKEVVDREREKHDRAVAELEGLRRRLEALR